LLRLSGLVSSQPPHPPPKVADILADDRREKILKAIATHPPKDVVLVEIPGSGSNRVLFTEMVRRVRIQMRLANFGGNRLVSAKMVTSVTIPISYPVM
jgi:hypothetical protein